jgi:hypothetical protein
MTYTLAISPGYRYDGETVEISQKLTENQYRKIEGILGRDRERSKEWAAEFHFDPETHGLVEELCAYLREQRIAHSVERRETFAPDTLEPQAASA